MLDSIKTKYMEKEFVKFKSGKLFPFHFQLLGVIFLFFGLLLLLFHPYFAPLALLLGGTIVTGYRGVEL